MEHMEGSAAGVKDKATALEDTPTPAPAHKKSNVKAQVPPFPTLIGEYPLLLSKTVEGNAMVTNFRLCVCERKSFLNLPLMMIAEATVMEPTRKLKLSCKDGSTVVCTFATSEDSRSCMELVRDKIAVPSSLQEMFAFRFYKEAMDKARSGARLTQAETEQTALCHNADGGRNSFDQEVIRLGFDTNKHRIWKMSHANEKYEFCPTYPKLHILPASVDDDKLKECTDFRAGKRFPSVVWRDGNTGVVLIRSSQPLPSFLGLAYFSNEADVFLLEEIVKACIRERVILSKQATSKAKMAPPQPQPPPAGTNTNSQSGGIESSSVGSSRQTEGQGGCSAGGAGGAGGTGGGGAGVLARDNNNPSCGAGGSGGGGGGGAHGGNVPNNNSSSSGGNGGGGGGPSASPRLTRGMLGLDGTNGASPCETTPAKPMLAIVDCRSRAMIWGNSFKGGGTEDEAKYKCSIIQLDLPNIHTVRDSFNKMRAVCHTYVEGSYYKSLCGSMWLPYISALLRGANVVVELMFVEKRPVLVHCSDGWDRTAQIVSLAELLMDPYYRTIKGFQILVEREWLQFGHKFGERGGHDPFSTDVNQQSPVFLQFLDCVYQLTLQYPAEFQFNEAYLVKLLKHSQACLFGTFLHNSEKERLHCPYRSASLWSLLREDNTQFVNLLYSSSHRVLTAHYGEHDIALWKSVYMAGLSPFPHRSLPDFCLDVGEDDEEVRGSNPPAPDGGVSRSRSVDDLSKISPDNARRSSDPNIAQSPDVVSGSPTSAAVVGTPSSSFPSPHSIHAASTIHDTSSSSAEIIHYPEDESSSAPSDNSGCFHSCESNIVTDEAAAVLPISTQTTTVTTTTTTTNNTGDTSSSSLSQQDNAANTSIQNTRVKTYSEVVGGEGTVDSDDGNTKSAAAVTDHGNNKKDNPGGEESGDHTRDSDNKSELVKDSSSSSPSSSSSSPPKSSSSSTHENKIIGDKTVEEDEGCCGSGSSSSLCGKDNNDGGGLINAESNNIVSSSSSSSSSNTDTVLVKPAAAGNHQAVTGKEAEAVTYAVLSSSSSSKAELPHHHNNGCSADPTTTNVVLNNCNSYCSSLINGTTHATDPKTDDPHHRNASLSLSNGGGEVDKNGTSDLTPPSKGSNSDSGRTISLLAERLAEEEDKKLQQVVMNGNGVVCGSSSFSSSSHHTNNTVKQQQQQQSSSSTSLYSHPHTTHTTAAVLHSSSRQQSSPVVVEDHYNRDIDIDVSVMDAGQRKLFDLKQIAQQQLKIACKNLTAAVSSSSSHQQPVAVDSVWHAAAHHPRPQTQIAVNGRSSSTSNHGSDKHQPIPIAVTTNRKSNGYTTKQNGHHTHASMDNGYVDIDVDVINGNTISTDTLVDALRESPSPRHHHIQVPYDQLLGIDTARSPSTDHHHQHAALLSSTSSSSTTKAHAHQATTDVSHRKDVAVGTNGTATADWRCNGCGGGQDLKRTSNSNKTSNILKTSLSPAHHPHVPPHVPPAVPQNTPTGYISLSATEAAAGGLGLSQGCTITTNNTKAAAAMCRRARTASGASSRDLSVSPSSFSSGNWSDAGRLRHASGGESSAALLAANSRRSIAASVSTSTTDISDSCVGKIPPSTVERQTGSVRQHLDVDSLTLFSDHRQDLLSDLVSEKDRKIAELESRLSRAIDCIRATRNRQFQQQQQQACPPIADEFLQNEPEGGEHSSLGTISNPASDASWEQVDEAEERVVLWVPDDAVTHCAGCDQQFVFYRRKHHCRNCGKIFCYECRNYLAPMPNVYMKEPQRVCRRCHSRLMQLSPGASCDGRIPTLVADG